MRIKKLAVLLLLGTLSLSACGGKSNTSGTNITNTEAETENADVVIGTYTYAEQVSFGDASFEVLWTMELKDDGTYSYSFENMMGEHVYTGTYAVEGTKVTTGTPTEGTDGIQAGFYNTDGSCEWILDVVKKTFAPAKEESAGIMEEAGKTTGTESEYPGTTAYLDVQYAAVSESDMLDLYVPENVENVPVIVMIHGGAFMFGDKQMPIVKQCIEPALSHGYAFATLNYRLSKETTYPGAVADVKAAVRFLKANADMYGIDADNIYIWGESAGAYLANMTAATAHVEELNGDITDNSGYDSGVKGLISFYAPVDWYQMDADFETLGVADTERKMGITGTDSSAESKFLGQNVMADKEVTDAASPLSYIEGMKQETFYAVIWHGNADINVPYLQSERLYDAFSEKYGTENVLLSVFEGAVHEDDVFYTAENLDKIFSFLDSIPR